MAAIHVGTKRTYQQMRGGHLDSQHALSLPQSREQSPKVTSPFRPASAAADYDSGSSVAPRSPQRRPRQATFGTSASIVLVGVKGTGKSSLGVIAASAYNYRLVESQRAFSDATGLSPSSYRTSHGNADYQQRNREILERTLQTHTERAVIVCSFSDLENGAASLLQDYSQTHPVIHVTRDSEGLHEYFRTWSLSRVNQLLLASASILRSCSNFDFFNLSESAYTQDQSLDSRSSKDREDVQGKYLTLKRVERDFLRLLRNVVGDHGRSIAHHSAYPLSQIDVDRRAHTFAVCLDAQDVLKDSVDLETAQTGADCIELLCDADGIDQQIHLQNIAHAFAIVRRNSILPIWLSVRLDGKSQPDTHEDVYNLISYCLSLAPELCSVDLRLSDERLERLIKSKSSTKLIALATYDQRPAEGWNDPGCLEMYTGAAAMDFDLVKITMPPGPAEEAFDFKAFAARAKRLSLSTGLIAYEEGADGRLSRCFNEILTSVQPPELAIKPPKPLKHSRSDITARAITEALTASFILEPLRFYIYGRDVGYSLSPAMDNAAFHALGLKHELTTFECQDLAGFRKLVREEDFGGAAMLQPFKTVVMPMLDSVSSHARAIGAVNTVIPIREFEEGGRIPGEIDIIRQRNRQGPLLGLYGTNTDWIGIRSCVRRGLSPANAVRPVSTGLICGAGGMARAAVHALASLGCQNIFICNRTPANAHIIADHYNGLLATGAIPELGTSNTPNTRVKVIENFASPWPTNTRHPTMIVNCIPSDDTSGSPIDFELPPAWLKSPTGGVVVEVAYKRPLTPLIRQVRALADKGWILHDGFDVLPEQAYAQFEMFTGRRAPRRLMREQVLRHYREMTTAAETEREHEVRD